MSSLRCFAVCSTLVVLLGVTPVGAQQDAPAAPPPCVSDWSCGATQPPLGFYVDSVTDGGRYVRLEDGTLWEVQIDHRALVAGWQRDDFVAVRRIWAPTGDYEWQFTKIDQPDLRAAVRLAGWTRARG